MNLMTRIMVMLKNNVVVGLSEPPGFSLTLEEGEDVSLPHGALHVPDDLTVLLRDELNLK